mmetsp:Transcript_18703/g.27509  ORF Transcript_18703/g.27509 Transcript_18703/m.27509 type:complete len:207 (-) Transcript_18703:34-654(-)
MLASCHTLLSLLSPSLDVLHLYRRLPLSLPLSRTASHTQAHTHRYGCARQYGQDIRTFVHFSYVHPPLPHARARTHAHTHTHTHNFIRTHLHTCTHTPTYIHTSIQTYIHACIHVYSHIHTCKHTFVKAHIPTYGKFIHAYIHTNISCMRTYISKRILGVHVYAGLCVHRVFTHTCLMYVCRYVYLTHNSDTYLIHTLDVYTRMHA